MSSNNSLTNHKALQLLLFTVLMACFSLVRRFKLQQTRYACERTRATSHLTSDRSSRPNCPTSRTFLTAS